MTDNIRRLQQMNPNPRTVSINFRDFLMKLPTPIKVLQRVLQMWRERERERKMDGLEDEEDDWKRTKF